MALKVLIDGKTMDKADVVSFSYEPEVLITEKRRQSCLKINAEI
jgi:hypothetical protein